MLSNIFSQIQNGFLTKKTIIIIQIYSTFLLNFLNILIQEGYIYGYKILPSKKILIYLKYINKKPSLFKIKQFKNFTKIKKKKLIFLKNSLFLYIISTPQGIMSHKKALKYNHGGVIICKII